MEYLLKNLFISCFIVAICVADIQAQDIAVTYGKITQDEADMTVFPGDPDAEAVILYETGLVRFVSNHVTDRFDLVTERKIKIKILKQAGLKYANFEIPLYEGEQDFEKIYALKAVTYNYENNELVKTPLNEKNIFEERINNRWITKKFAMPNVKEGSIIEVEYQIISPYISNIPTWQFQYPIPVVYSNLTIRIIPYYEYAFIVKGTNKFDEYSTEALNTEHRFYNIVYREMEYRMGMKNVPAFRDEEFISSPKDYMISLHFQLSKWHSPRGGNKDYSSTWKNINDNWFLKSDNFGKFISAAEKEAKKILPALPLEGKTQEERIQIISDYVRMNYNWDGTLDKFANKNFSSLLKEKTGNSAELNFLLLGLLRKAGIAAKPIALSTRSNGSVDVNFPFEEFLNYVIVQANTDEKTLFLDATESMLRYNELPERCINVRGLIVDKDSEEWTEIVQDELSQTEKEFNIKCNSDLTSLNATISYVAQSYDAYKYRKIYYGEEQKLKDFFERRDVKIAGDITIKNYDDFEQDFVFSFDTEAPLINSSDKLFIPPFLNHSPQENIFKQTKRTLSVDLLYRKGETFVSHIEIPAGYKVESLPKTVNHKGRFVTLTYKAEQNGNRIDVSAHYEFMSNIYDAKLYQGLKASYAEIVKTLNEMIVLVKE